MDSSLNVQGGSLTFFQRSSAWVTSNIYLTVFIIAILVISLYFLISATQKNTSGYKANKEHERSDINSNKTATIMLFTADWCPHCKTAKPEWEDLKAEYENKTINGYVIVFEENNCTENNAETEAIMDKYKIEGFPTIKLLKDNQVIEYDAKPTKSTMETFLNTVI